MHGKYADFSGLSTSSTLFRGRKLSSVGTLSTISALSLICSLNGPCCCCCLRDLFEMPTGPSISHQSLLFHSFVVLYAWRAAVFVNSFSILLFLYVNTFFLLSSMLFRFTLSFVFSATADELGCTCWSMDQEEDHLRMFELIPRSCSRLFSKDSPPPRSVLRIVYSSIRS